MLVYSGILFLTAVLFLAMGIATYRGNTKLIHDYHQTNIKGSDQQAYGRAFAKGLFAVCATLFISGVIALFDHGASFAASLVVLAAGLIVSFIILVKVQKKYNGGLF